MFELSKMCDDFGERFGMILNDQIYDYEMSQNARKHGTHEKRMTKVAGNETSNFQI